MARIATIDYDFDVWVLMCLLCEHNICGDGVLPAPGAISAHFATHGVYFPGCYPTEAGHIVARDTDGRDDWCITAESTYATEWGRGQEVLLAVRSFGMGTPGARSLGSSREVGREAESHSAALDPPTQYGNTGQGENGPLRGSQEHTGHAGGRV